MKEQYLELIKEYTDKNGFIKPQKDWQDSGNGLLYTALDMLVRKERRIEQRTNYSELVQSCMKEPGLLMRTPTNDYGQQQWDDYLGVALGCKLINNTDIPKQILKYGVSNFFVFNNDNKLELKDFLGRYIHVFACMLVAAYPIMSYILTPFISMIGNTMIPNDASGINLQWAYIQFCNEETKHNWYSKLLNHYGCIDPISNNMEKYMSKDHPFSIALKGYL